MLGWTEVLESCCVFLISLFQPLFSQIALELRSNLREVVSSSINHRFPDTAKEKFLPANVAWKYKRKKICISKALLGKRGGLQILHLFAWYLGCVMYTHSPPFLTGRDGERQVVPQLV